MARRREREYQPEKYCSGVQYYKGIPLTLIIYTERHFAALRAKRFMLGDPKYNQNIWIPNTYLDESGHIKEGFNLDWAMQKAYRENKFKYAHIAINPYTWREENDLHEN